MYLICSGLCLAVYHLQVSENPLNLRLNVTSTLGETRFLQCALPHTHSRTHKDLLWVVVSGSFFPTPGVSLHMRHASTVIIPTPGLFLCPLLTHAGIF